MTLYEILATSLNIAVLLVVLTAFYWRGRMPVAETRLAQPVAVREQREPTWAELKALEQRVTALETRMSAAFEKFHQDVRKIHDKIDAADNRYDDRHSEVMRILGRLETSLLKS